MKIHADQLNALLRQEQAAKKDAPDGSGFGAVFAGELGQVEARAQGAQLPPLGAQAGLISGLLLDSQESVTAADPTEDIIRQSFQQASELLDSWDTYANALSSGNDLKSVYPMLEGLEKRIQSLRQGSAPLAGKHAGLDSLINELEVLASTEKFKFNRGDYLQ